MFFHQVRQIFVLMAAGLLSSHIATYNPADDDNIDETNTFTVGMHNGLPATRPMNGNVDAETEAGELMTEADDFEEIDPPIDEYNNEESPDADQSGKSDVQRQKRFALNNVRKQWTHGIIPYLFDSSLPEKKKQHILQVIFPRYQYWTHFRFVEWNTSVPELYKLSHKNYLKFVSSRGCFSYMGNTFVNGQRISCCEGNTCVHEIGHVIGLYHEQSSPLRDDYIRIHYDNINNGRVANFVKRRDQHNGYFDLSSIMMYTPTAFSKNYMETITAHDSELSYLMWRKDSSAFYMFSEIQQLYNMRDKKCPEFPMECLNGGYLSFVNGSCRCRCSMGMDYRTGCATPIGADNWPKGSYSILRHGNDCPAGFLHGEIKVWTGHIGKDIAQPFADDNIQHDLANETSVHPVTLAFCTKLYEHMPGTGAAWQPGQYCLFKANPACPGGFQSGTFQSIASSLKMSKTGILPDIEYSTSLKLTLCCRDDGSVTVPISLPGQTSFVLMSNCSDGCQAAHEVPVTVRNISEMWSSLGFNNSRLTACTYQKQPESDDQTCGNMIYLSDSNPRAHVTSPNYPQEYTGKRSCVWFIQGPINSSIVLEFSDFALFKGVQSTCNGHLEVKYALPGQPGVKYCGDGFKRSIVSKTHSLSVILTGTTTKAVEVPSYKRFNATVTLIKADDLCYTNGGKDNSYQGKINYGQHFESCVPWDRVTHCPYHQFNLTGVDLESNYCRNPGHGTEPWCYINVQNCDRVNCDVCQLRKCYDVFGDCTDLIKRNSKYCEHDPEATRGCRSSCGLCTKGVKPTPVSRVTCGLPTPAPPGGILVSDIKVSYRVGEKITYKCNISGIQDNQQESVTCSSNGHWTHVTHICGNGSACADRRSDCELLLRRNPSMCHEYRDFASAKCAYTCGTCSPGSTSEKAVCKDTGVLTNATVVDPGVYSHGDVVRYVCDKDNVLSDGNLIRACQVGGSYTGSSPVCIDKNKAVTELFHVDIRRRKRVGSRNTAYTFSNKYYRINRTGEITAWKFHSKSGGLVEFHVWRQVANTSTFKLIGKNTIADTLDTRQVTVNITLTQRISVDPGDFIGIFYPKYRYGGIPYDNCKSGYNPEGTNHWQPINGKLPWKPGQFYQMKMSTVCRLFSLSAVIGPRKQIQKKQRTMAEIVTRYRSFLFG